MVCWQSGHKMEGMRSMLGRFGLSGHHHLQPIAKLSGAPSSERHSAQLRLSGVTLPPHCGRHSRVPGMCAVTLFALTLILREATIWVRVGVWFRRRCACGSTAYYSAIAMASSLLNDCHQRACRQAVRRPGWCSPASH